MLLHSLNVECTGRCLRAKALGTKFAEEFLCEHGTSLCQICEPNPERKRSVIDSLMHMHRQNKKGVLLHSFFILVTRTGIEPMFSA